ncbi:MAG: TIM barrel protein [Candidatus Omnitrophica bacterium]|nr:TIM barrel protein [Candidatus Omnitrophota bacterium]
MSSRSSYSLSTAWNYRRHDTAKSIIDEARSMGFESLELNFALTEPRVNEFIELKNQGYINISSTHNFCPLPDGVIPEKASPEYYSLSSPDDEERALALRFTKKSMDFAKKAQAKAFIIHLGSVRMKDPTKRLFTTADKAKFEERKRSAFSERAKKVKPYLDASLKSIGALTEYAGLIGLDIALENRYYIKELPSLEEFKIIFELFDDERLFYWHDTGHAQIYENLSILKHEDYLETLSSRLLGMHLHDIILFDDHRAPGSGEFDFGRLKPFVKKDTIKVIEAHRASSKEEVERSLPYLTGILGQ